MSSLSPIDSAWSLLQNDDKIEKVLPLLIPAAMAGYGAIKVTRMSETIRLLTLF